jgi:predicted RNA-binding Zn-ribbon protein involved in translation (DUF1610 family)
MPRYPPYDSTAVIRGQCRNCGQVIRPQKLPVGIFRCPHCGGKSATVAGLIREEHDRKRAASPARLQWSA